MEIGAQNGPQMAGIGDIDRPLLLGGGASFG